MCFNNFLIRALSATVLAGLIASCGGGGGGSASAPPPPPTNILPVTVDLGPTDENGKSVNAANTLYTTVTVCQPGSSTNCTTIDHVLVDTGSTGLRLLSSQLPSSLALPNETTSTGLPVLNCVQFVDNSFMWGPVATADVVLAGNTASNVPIQVIGAPTYDSLSGICQTGTPMNSIATLGAKGILGVGLFLQDCGSACAAPVSSINYYSGVYYTCTDARCSAATDLSVSASHQLQNPVSLFATNNNGLVVSLPSVASSATSITGSIYFGINTLSNNTLTRATLLPTDGYGNITTVFQGASTDISYIDSGSNALYFNSSTIPLCAANSVATGFYCPNALTPLTAVLSVTPPTTTPASVAVPFSIDNAAGSSVFGGSGSWSVYPTLAAPSGAPTFGFAAAFDWGLPFFFGKHVAIGFEGHTSTLGSGTYFAF